LFSQNENLSEYLKKGAQVLVFGELRIEEFKSDTGNMVKISNITVLSIDIVKFVENQQNTNKEN
jgi:single-stranded DNA-binding protein